MRATRANTLQRAVCVALLGGALLFAGCETPTSRARSAGELLNEADPVVASSRSPVRAIAESEAVVASEPIAVGEGAASVTAVQTMPPAVVAALAPAPAPQASPVAVGERTSRIELAGKDVFEAGSWVLTQGSAALLRQQMSRLPRERPLAIAVFNQPSTARVNRSGRVLRDLSEVRAEKLAEFLRSPEGGAWTIERAVGRGLDVVDGRAADRRVEIYVAE